MPPDVSDATRAPPVAESLRARVVVIAMGLFVTGLGWPNLIGRLPFGLFLKNELHLPAQSVAAFWAVGSVAWYLKPLVGLMCDAHPLLGTRRRAYLVLGTVSSMAMWLAFLVVPRTYAVWMVVMVALNLGLVLVSTTVGGMLVETGQRYGATGRLSSLREGLVGAMQLAAGPLGGWLASHAFGWTVGAGTCVVLSFLPAVLLGVREPRLARPDHASWVRARAQVRSILRSRAMWATSALIFLVYLAPGFQTPLLYYQQDVLKFRPQLMGVLDAVAGASALVGAAIYGVVCRRLPLRQSLVGGILLNAGSTLLYLAYKSPTSAFVVNGVGGALSMLGVLPLFDLAARATPRGSESFGYSLVMSVQNISIFAVSEVLGSYLYGHLHWTLQSLVWINSLSTLAVLAFVAFLPAALVATREGALSSASA
jgi:predicted MFS family arabinose efflux permease